MEIRWGLAPDMTATQLLPALVGIDVAKELTFTGRIVGGREAVELGMCTRLSDAPRDDALALAAEIAALNPDAVRRSKQLLNLAGTVPLAEGFAAERRAARELIGSPNQLEAVAAGMAKRPAVFADPS
jgi:enoyl-CoA hydratase/carnithine racemase